MVLINIEQVDGKVIMNCYKHTEDGEYFRMILDAGSGKVLERPDYVGVDESTAYGHVLRLIKSGQPLPQNTVSEWG